MNRTPTSFYDALPYRKVELWNGQFLVGGSIEKTAMAMTYILEAYGAEYAAQWIPKEILQEALIEVYGNSKEITKIANYDVIERKRKWSQLRSHLMMSFFKEEDLVTLGPDFVMRLGMDSWSPDITILFGEDRKRLYSYYLDGAASLLVEMVTPSTIHFDSGIRLQSYAKGGVAEIWRIDEYNQQVTQLILKNQEYQSTVVNSEYLLAQQIPTLKLHIPTLWETPMKAISMEENKLPTSSSIAAKNGMGWGSLPYAPRFALAPVAISFEEYISWTGEAKFEFMGKPIFGGGDESTLQFLGMCMMTLGIKEVVKYLPAEEWSKVL